MRLIGLLAAAWSTLVVLALATLWALLSLGPAHAQIYYPPGKWPKADPWHHVYPPECKADLSYLMPSVNIDRTRRVEDMFPSYNGRNMGWFDVDPIRPTIYIDRSVTNDATYRIMLHHELCHFLMYRLTGDLTWHGRRRAWQSRKRSRRRSSPFARLSNR